MTRREHLELVRQMAMNEPGLSPGTRKVLLAIIELIAGMFGGPRGGDALPPPP